MPYGMAPMGPYSPYPRGPRRMPPMPMGYGYGPPPPGARRRMLAQQQMLAMQNRQLAMENQILRAQQGPNIVGAVAGAINGLTGGYGRPGYY